MQITLNGKSQGDLPANITISGLIDRLELGGKRLAVEVDGVIVPRSQHESTTLIDGSRVEIVAAIGGG